MKTLFRLSLMVVALSGCMAMPAQREAQDKKLDPIQACKAQCTRDNNICLDQQSAGRRGGDVPYGAGAACQSALQSCLNRCGLVR